MIKNDYRKEKIKNMKKTDVCDKCKKIFINMLNLLEMNLDNDLLTKRVKNPDLFSRFRTKDLGNNVYLVLGKLKNSDEWEIQSVRFIEQIEANNILIRNFKEMIR